MPDLDDIEHCLEVGRPAVLSISARRGGELTARAVIRGWQSGTYVLLDVPDGSGLGVGPRVGDQCKLRFLADGEACGLDATLIDLGSGSHFSFVKLAWPHAVTLARVRKHPRVQVHLPCTVQMETGDPVSGEIQDISAGGCRIALDRSMAKESQVSIVFELPDSGTPATVAAEVCSLSTIQAGVNLGCKFVDIGDALGYSIDFYVATAAVKLRSAPARSNQVLIVNPDLSQVAPLKQALAAQDYDVIVAPTMLDGFYWLRASSPSLLLLHAEPKPFRGVDILSSLRSMPAFAAMPVVLYGGAASDQKAALDAGATHYFPSSAQVQELVAAVVTSLNPTP